MESRNSHFWLGLGIGSVIGAMIYRFSCTPKAKQLKQNVCHALHKAGGETEDMLETAKDKAMNMGTKVADKVAEGSYKVADKADDMKDKMHNLNAENKR